MYPYVVGQLRSTAVGVAYLLHENLTYKSECKGVVEHKR